MNFTYIIAQNTVTYYYCITPTAIVSELPRPFFRFQLAYDGSCIIF